MAKATKKSTLEMPALPAVPISPEQKAEIEKARAFNDEFARKIDDANSGRNLARQIARELRQTTVASPPPATVAEVTGDFYTARDLVVAVAKNLKDAGEIHKDTTRTLLAKKLAGRMRKAIQDVKLDQDGKPDRSMPGAVDYRHIRHKLRDWGLWPISSI